MITNATLVSTATPTTSAAGNELYGAATALGARCTMTGVTQKQRDALGAKFKDVTAKLRVLKTELATEPPPRTKIVATVDGSASKSYRVVEVGNAQKDGGLAHWILYLVELL